MSQMYMVCKKWRGAINVDSMRIMDEAGAAERAKELRESPAKWQLRYDWHMYKMYANQPPKHVTKADLLHLYSL